MLNLSTKVVINKDLIDSPNLCDRFDDDDLDKIGGVVWAGYQKDKQSRSKWERRMQAGMDLAMQIQVAKNFPWPGCSNVIFPLITIAALQFSARSYPAIIQGADVVKYRVIGDDVNGLLRQRADRIGKHMSWQVLEEDMAWEEQHDRLLINLGIVGTNFIKSQFNPSLGHNTSELVMARDFVLDYWAKSVESCSRKTQVVPLYKNEIYERVQAKIFCDVLDEEWFTSGAVQQSDTARQDARSGLSPSEADDDTPFKTLEQHRFLDLDGDGYAEPYIATIEEQSKHLVRLVSRINRVEDIERKDDRPDGRIRLIRPTEYFTKYSFIPAPDGGIYDVGFGILLGPLNEAVNSGINQLLDSGTMQISMGGFLGRGAKIRGGVYTMAPWEWKRVDSTGDDLRKSMVPFPERQPSTVMFQLLGLLINYTDRIAGTVDTMVGENPGQNTPAETSRNMTEQGMQVFNVIFKRVWRSMKEEFKKLHSLNANFLPSRQRFGDAQSFILQEDYKSNPDMVVPAANPNITSKAQRVMQATAVRTAAHTVQGYDQDAAERQWLSALEVEGSNRLYLGVGKVPPLPNPKMQVEEMKLAAKKMTIDFEKWKTATSLMEQMKLNAANIDKLKAEAAKIVASIGEEQAAHQLKAFEVAIGALNEHNQTMNERMQMLLAPPAGGTDGDSTGGGGVPGMESGAGNAKANGTAATMA